MTPYRSSALLASAALVLGATITPVVAFADDAATPDPSVVAPADPTDSASASPTDTASASPTDSPTTDPTPTVTDLTITQLRADLTALQTAAVAAEKAGWSLTGTETLDNAAPAPVHARYDGSAGTLTETGMGSMIEVQGEGSYISVSTLAGMPGLRSGLKALAKPHATWIFEADKTLDLLTGDGMTASLAPSGLLGSLADPKAAFSSDPTETVAADGTTTYQFSATLPDEEDSGAITLTVSPDGLLTGVDTAGSDASSMTYAYAPQPHIAIPAKSTVVTEDQLFQGIMLSTLPAETKSIAKKVATQATKDAKKHAVKPAIIRSAAGTLTKRDNAEVGVRAFTTKRIPGGVRITGTNPHTGSRTVYTVTAAGTKAVARKA